MSKTINVGLVGFGMAGSIFHAPTISCVDGLQLLKIRETKSHNVAAIKARYPHVQVVQDTGEIFGDPLVDLVVLATPNVTHYSLVKEAIAAGKHVLVDKPFTVTSAEADQLTQYAKAQNRLLTVYHNRRWDSDFLTVKKIISSGLLGNLVEYESHYDRFRNTLRPDTWKEDGVLGTGVLYDLGSHLIDGALMLFGLPERVYADLRCQRRDTKIIDNFEIVLDYGQLKVTLKAGMLVKEPSPRYILYGNNGSFIKYGLDVQEEMLSKGINPKTVSNWGGEPESIWGTINTEYKGVEFRGKVKSENGNYVALYQNIYKVLNGEEDLIVTPEQARNTIRVIEYAMQSNEEKRTVTCSW